MKTWRRALIGGAAAVAISVSAVVAINSSGGQDAGSQSAGVAVTTPVEPSTAATTTAALSSDEIAGLVFSREEERLARDLYTLLADRYDARRFAMIATSEQQHFEAVGTLLTRYGIADPSAGAQPGVYADPALQALYDGWKSDSAASLTAAYAVGVQLEKRDIADLQRLQDATARADLDGVYAQLEKGSWRHLAAFSGASSA